MAELGRAEVILDGVGRLEEAQELVDVRLEVVDLVWNWESQGLVAEGAVRTYIYYQKEDGTIEGEGVEIPFHGVVLPPASAAQAVRVRLEEVREEHQFDPQDRSFSQSIHLFLVAEPAPEEPDAVEPAAGEPGVPEPPTEEPLKPAQPSPAPEVAAPQEEAEVAVPVARASEVHAAEPDAEAVPAPEAPLPAAQSEPSGPPSREAEELAPSVPEAGKEGADHPTPALPPRLEPAEAPAEAPLVAAHAAPSATGGGAPFSGAQPSPEAPAVDDGVIVWKPFPDE